MNQRLTFNWFPLVSLDYHLSRNQLACIKNPQGIIKKLNLTDYHYSD